jgi:ectoine hydroxylase-related dioxygenase (phytanoyl-CoA dioxygenase family)
MKIQAGDIKEALDRDGYAVVRDVFSAEEIARMRRDSNHAG